MSAPESRRSQTVVDKKLQYRLVWRIGALGAFYFTASLGVVTAFPILFSYFSESSEQAMAQARFRLDVLFSVVLLPLLITFVCLWVHGVRETLRLAGPNMRFRRAFDQVRQGVIPAAVRIREGDYLQDTAQDFNEAMQALQTQLGRAQLQQAEAEQAWSQAQQSGSDEDFAAARQASEKLGRTLAHFQLPAVEASSAEESEPRPAESAGSA